MTIICLVDFRCTPGSVTLGKVHNWTSWSGPWAPIWWLPKKPIVTAVWPALCSAECSPRERPSSPRGRSRRTLPPHSGGRWPI